MALEHLTEEELVLARTGGSHRLTSRLNEAREKLAKWHAWERAWVLGGEAEWPGSSGVVDPREQFNHVADEFGKALTERDAAIARAEAAEAERDRLRTALEAVELFEDSWGYHCPWCRESSKRKDKFSHAPYCQRQAALGVKS